MQLERPKVWWSSAVLFLKPVVPSLVEALAIVLPAGVGFTGEINWSAFGLIPVNWFDLFVWYPPSSSKSPLCLGVIWISEQRPCPKFLRASNSLKACSTSLLKAYFSSSVASRINMLSNSFVFWVQYSFATEPSSVTKLSLIYGLFSYSGITSI